MITRIWHGRIRAEDADVYMEYVKGTGIQDYKKTSGNISVKILRRMENDICHIWTVSEWRDLESIKKFAGEDFERARYYPEDSKYLLEFEEMVIHCETFVF